MSTSIISRSPTLEQIARAIDDDQTIEKRRKQDLLSALNACSRVLGMPLANLPSDPRQLGPRLAAVAPAAHKITDGRWANIRSLVGKAIATAHPLLPGRQDHPLDPAWEELLEQLEPRYQRAAVIAGLRWLSAQDIGPAAVTREDVERFMEALRTQSLRTKPDDVCRRFVVAWNAARETVPGWPSLPLVWESRRVVRSLPWSEFPASFKEDVDRWLDRQSGKDLFAVDGPSSPLKAITRKSYEGMMRTNAWALVQAGVPPQAICSLADLVTTENFKLILQDLWSRTGEKKSSTLARQADVLIAMARHYLPPGKADLAGGRQAVPRRQPGPVRERVKRLHAELNRPEVRAQATEILRSLIEEIRLVPENGRLEIEVAGDLARILALAPNDKRPRGGAEGAQVTLVAGTRNQPAVSEA